MRPLENTLCLYDTLRLFFQSSSPGFPYPTALRLGALSQQNLLLCQHMCLLDNSFPSVRQEPTSGPWKGSTFLQQMATLAGTLLR